MKIRELLAYLETIAPPAYQESYDNAGLIVGDAAAEIRGVLVCLDSTEAIVEEALERGCNLIVAHHPIVFKGLKRLTGSTYVERTVMKAIKHDIAIYAIHTNLDNVYHQGVNAKIAEMLGLADTRILAPKAVQQSLSALVPTWSAGSFKRSLGELGLSAAAISLVRAGAGQEQCKVETHFPAPLQRQVLQALAQSLDGQLPAYQITAVETPHRQVGSGMIGRLPQAMPEADFLRFLKERMKVACIRHTALRGKPIETVALCGGAGGFLLGKAIAQQADVFITADYKYHEFFDADGRILIADIGHFESEQFTIELLYDIISQKFSNFAAYSAKAVTNPVHYFW
jgi:dinuclear metal center YbgI/SA1388 family protein